MRDKTGYGARLPNYGVGMMTVEEVREIQRVLMSDYARMSKVLNIILRAIPEESPKYLSDVLQDVYTTEQVMYMKGKSFFEYETLGIALTKIEKLIEAGKSNDLYMFGFKELVQTLIALDLDVDELMEYASENEFALRNNNWN